MSHLVKVPAVPAQYYISLDIPMEADGLAGPFTQKTRISIRDARRMYTALGDALNEYDEENPS